MSGALVSVGGILVPPDVACVAVVDKLVAGLVAKGVDLLEAMNELMSMTGAAQREGLDINQVFRTLLDDIESGEHTRRSARDVEARKCRVRFDRAADRYRRRYEEKEGKEGALTFDEAVAAFKLLPWVDEDRGLDAFRAMLPEVLEGIGKRKDLEEGWKRHTLYKLMPRVESIARAQGGEGEWAGVLKMAQAGAARLARDRGGSCPGPPLPVAFRWAVLDHSNRRTEARGGLGLEGLIPATRLEGEGVARPPAGANAPASIRPGRFKGGVPRGTSCTPGAVHPCPLPSKLRIWDRQGPSRRSSCGAPAPGAPSGGILRDF